MPGPTKTSAPFWKRVIETGNQTESDLDRAITLVEQTGAMQETMRRARAYADEAKAALRVMPDSDIKRALGGHRGFLRRARLLNPHASTSSA